MRARAAVIVFLIMLAVVGVLSSRQVAADTYPLDFPRERDSWKLTDSCFYTSGDYVAGAREVDITKFNKINRIEIYLDLERNTLTPKFALPLVFEVSLNGETVGTFSVYGSDGSKPTKTVYFQSDIILTKSSLGIRYQVKENKDPYGSIIVNKKGSSTLTLGDGLAPKTKKDFASEALDKLKELRSSVDESNINQGPERSLLSKLDRAISKVNQALIYIDQDREQQANNKLRTAKNLVLSFIRALDAFPERIAPSDNWQTDANQIIELIETAIETPITP